MPAKKHALTKSKAVRGSLRATSDLIEKYGVELYRLMARVRSFEDKVLELCMQNLVPGIAQLCQGQEATVVGSVFPLKTSDYLCPTYRGHGHCIVKGTPLVSLMAEILGRASGFGLIGLAGLVGTSWASASVVSARNDPKQDSIIPRHRMKLAPALAAIVCTLCAVRLQGNQQASRPGGCEEPEYFGICDPFVPGTLVRLDEPKEFRVLSTWPRSPAEKAGICPGDQIVAVNTVSGSGGSLEPMLRELVSPSPNPVHLRVERGSREMVFRVPRVRESTLARLSKQKFVRTRDLISGKYSALVPADQSREEVKQLEEFLRRVERRYGFKWEAGLWVPDETPHGNIQLLLTLRPGSRAWDRVRQTLTGSFEFDAYSPGFLVKVLGDPREAIVDLVLPGSPAHQAGLVPGDQLLEVDGRAVSSLSPEDLAELLFKPDGPRQIKLQAKRGDSRFEAQLATQRAQAFRIEDYRSLPLRTRALRKDDYILGVEVLRAEKPPEAVIAGVDYPSPAFHAGLHVGDLLLAINGKPMEEISREQLADLLSPTGPAETTLTVSREGREIKFRLRPVTFGQAQATIGRIVTKFGPAVPACAEAQ